MQCDVTSDQHVDLMKMRVQKLTDEDPTTIMYAIVNNAGIADPGDFVWYPDTEAHRRVMEVNYFGQLRITQSLLPIMLKTSRDLSNGARIINLSSVCGTSASPANSAYNASKFAVEAWSDSLRIELEPFNIQVVKVRPGQISTQIQADFVQNLLKNYMAAPQNIKELYGGDDYLKTMTDTIQAMSTAPPPPQPDIVIDAMMEMLNEKENKPYYWIGKDAHTLWRTLHVLPAHVADFVKRKLFYFAPVVERAKLD